MKALIRPTVSLLLIGLSILGLLNVYGDNSEVEALARKSACESCESDELALTMLSRTPLSQTFHFHRAQSGTTVVECSRNAVFFGEYACITQ